MDPILLDLTLIDLAVVGGVALVLPTGLGGRWRWWLLVAGAAVLACRADRGTVAATAVALPWPGLVAVLAVHRLRHLGWPPTWGLADAAGLASFGYALGAGGWFVASRAGASPLGVHEPIVELTAVHFTYVGVGAVALAIVARRRATVATVAHRLADAGLVLVVAAPPVVALGFVTGAAAAQIGGAVLLTIGVFAVALVQLHQVVRDRSLDGASRVLLAVSGLAVWVPMLLAVAWAAGQHVDVPALSIPDMVRTHGAINAIAFIGAGLVARRHDLAAHPADTPPERSVEPPVEPPTANVVPS